MSGAGLAAALLLSALGRASEPVRADAGDPAAAEVEAAIEAGVRWLVENQRPDGAFGSHHTRRPIEVLADVPGSHDAFRVATTALCVMALAKLGEGSEAAERAHERALDGLLRDFDVKRVDGTEHYNVWAFGYALQAFGEHLTRHPEDPRAGPLRAACERLVDKLGRYQDLDGGWGYLSLAPVRTYRPSFTSMSFTTATVLVGLERAAEAGVDVPERMLDRALDCLARCRTPLGAFTYGPLWNRAPVAEINLGKGSACRTPACLLALDLHGRELEGGTSFRDAYRRALEELLVEYARFQVVALRRPIPHESWYGISGYFYLYGTYYAALALDELDDPGRHRFAGPLARAVLRTRQPDGSFWDYPLYSYHKAYGTAYALLALARARVAADGG